MKVNLTQCQPWVPMSVQTAKFRFIYDSSVGCTFYLNMQWSWLFKTAKVKPDILKVRRLIDIHNIYAVRDPMYPTFTWLMLEQTFLVKQIFKHSITHLCRHYLVSEVFSFRHVVTQYAFHIFRQSITQSFSYFPLLACLAYITFLC